MIRPAIKLKLSFKKWGVPLLILFAIFHYAPRVQAKAGLPLKIDTSASLSLWNQEIKHVLLIKNDPRLPFDGEAYTKTHKGVEKNFIVLNKAYFEKEAKELFQKFVKIRNAPANKAKHPYYQLSELEREILLAHNSTNRPLMLNYKLKSVLRELKESMEMQAWSALFQNSVEKTDSLKKAEEFFIKYFIASRMKTIHFHEAAHIIDCSKTTDRDSVKFKRYSELNAFYTELAYGENPRDVISQTLVGVLDELKQGKSVDFSIEKLTSLLNYLKNKNTGSTLLALVNNQNFREAGHFLYETHTQTQGLTRPSLLASK